MDTGVRDLEVAFFKANSTWFNDICSKNLSDRLIYAVLNIHNLGMILQLKDMPTVMNPVRIASSDWKPSQMLWSLIRVIFKTSSVTPDFFYVFNLVLSFSTCSQSFNKICVWEVLGANVLKQRQKLIGHFRVPLCLCFKASLSAKPFLWKWLWFAWKWNCMQNSFS